jgi:hypothetical protein
MPTLKLSFFLLPLVLLSSSLCAQDKLNIKFGKVKPEDFDVKSALIDSSTSAVVIADVGSSAFVANTNDRTFSLVFIRKTRMKIINKNGFDAATIVIPLFVSDNSKAEKLDDLDAITFNLENGKVIETKVDKSTVFTEKHSKNWIYKKFTFPALKEGSIIEYSYKVKSDFFFNLQPWTFQGSYPILWSQYDAGILEFVKYSILSQGYQVFFINKTEQTKGLYSFVEHENNEATGSVISNTNSFTIEGTVDYHTWVMQDVPALKEEPYTTTLRNSIAKIEFQLSQIVMPNTPPQNYTNTWKKVSEELRQSEDFGMQVYRANNWLDDEVKNIVNAAVTQEEKAIRIFEYVRDHFTFNNDNGIYLTASLKEVFKNKNGSVADINLLLIAMLKNQKINVSPVILSTRSNGFTHEFYPLINRYNYVIAKVDIGSNIFYLDATDRQLAFGMLQAKVYNGQAREITTSTALAIDFKPDSLKESGMTSVYISNVETGKPEGSFSQNMGMVESQQFRARMTKTIQDDFKKSMQLQYPEEITIENIQVDDLKILEKPVALTFDLKFKSFEDDIVYFNPMLSKAIKKNPFTVANRFYPVEMPYAADDTYNFTMEVPKGYKVDELPKSVRFNLNEDEGMFEYLISQKENTIQMRCRLLLKKATFTNEEYQSLREFYSFVVKKEAEQIVFKKIK